MQTSPILFLDTASPVVSVALGGSGEVLAQRTIELRRSSERLLPVIDEVLGEAHLTLAGLAGIVALQGPGSFTGLRIGLATTLGLSQAANLPATAMPTLAVLAAAAPAGERDIVAAVDAIRGDWVVQRFRGAADETGPAGKALSEPELSPAAALREFSACRIVGFGIGQLESGAPWPASSPGVELIEPPPLAPVAAGKWPAADIEWDASRLTAPIYFRPPAVTVPKR